MVSGTWISSQQKGTIALRVYREISANQSVLHWGGERLRGGGGYKGTCTVRTHTHSGAHTCSWLLCVLCEGSVGCLILKVGRKCSCVKAGLTSKWLRWRGGSRIKKIEICFLFAGGVSVQIWRKDSVFYEWAAPRPYLTMDKGKEK